MAMALFPLIRHTISGKSVGPGPALEGKANSKGGPKEKNSKKPAANMLFTTTGNI